MNILCIVNRTPRNMLCFDTSYYTLAQVRLNVAINESLLIVVEDTDTDIIYTANLSQMMLELPEIALHTDWASLEDFLTAGMLSTFEITGIIPRAMYTRDVTYSNFGEAVLQAYGGSPAGGVMTLDPNELGFQISDDRRKAYTLFPSMPIVPGMMLEFDMHITELGLLHAIGITTTLSSEPSKLFVLGGSATPTVEITTFNNHGVTADYVHVVIPIGEYYSGVGYQYFVFANDQDGGVGEMAIKNVVIYMDKLIPGQITIIESPVTTDEDTVGPKIISAGHQLGMTTGYGSHAHPEYRNYPVYRNALTEVIYSQDNPEDPIVNFDNCIPIVNGKVFYPVVFEDELYAMGALQVVRASATPNPETLLLDFSDMGGIELVRFKDCTTVDTPHGYTYQLPEGTTLANKNFVLVIAGRLVMSNEIIQLDDHTIAINPEQINIDNILLSNKALNGFVVQNTMNVNNTQTPAAFMAAITDEHHYDSFLMIIDNPEVAFHMYYHLYTIEPRMLKFPANVGGLLMRKMDRVIVDYTRQLDTDSSIVYLPETKQINRLIVTDPTNPMEIAYIGPSMPGFDHSINSKDDGYVMIDMIAKGV